MPARTPQPRVRNDSALNTGLSSAIDRKRLKKQKELHDKKQRAQEATRVSLSRDGGTIDTWLDEEIAKVSDLSSAVTEFDPSQLLKQIPLAQRMNITDKELLQAFMIAKLMHIEFLKDTKKKVNKFMKEPTVKGSATKFGEADDGN